MTDARPDQEPPAERSELSLLWLATVLLRWRYPIVGLAALGFLLAFAAGLARPRTHTSEATFIPQEAQSSTSPLALAASQFGMGMPQTGPTWGPQMYIRVLHSRALLEPIARESVTVAELGHRRIPLPEVLGVPPAPGDDQVTAAVDALSGWIKASEVKEMSGVRLAITTPWASVSKQLADRLLRAVNQFNIETRKSQAAAERQFAETQAAGAERALRLAEERLQSFLQRNRGESSPILAVERDRYEREVMLRQELHTTWLKNLEEARIREVRDTPVITVFESPRLPHAADPRNVVRKSVLGALVGGLLGVLLALFAQGMSALSRTSRSDVRDFRRLLDDATPRFLRRR